MKRKNNTILDNKIYIETLQEYNNFINKINMYKNIKYININNNDNNIININLSTIFNKCNLLKKLLIYNCNIIFDLNQKYYNINKLYFYNDNIKFINDNIIIFNLFPNLKCIDLSNITFINFNDNSDIKFMISSFNNLYKFRMENIKYNITLNISNCIKLKKIIISTKSGNNGSLISNNFINLNLNNLPELIKIYNKDEEEIQFNNINIINCPKLELINDICYINLPININIVNTNLNSLFIPNVDITINKLNNINNEINNILSKFNISNNTSTILKITNYEIDNEEEFDNIFNQNLNNLNNFNEFINNDDILLFYKKNNIQFILN